MRSPAPTGTVLNLVFWAILTPMEGANGNQEGRTGKKDGLARRTDWISFRQGAIPRMHSPRMACKDGLLDDVKKALAERALNAEPGSRINLQNLQ